VNNFVIFKQYGLENLNLGKSLFITIIDVRGQSAAYFKNYKKIIEPENNCYYESHSSLKNQPDGNAKRFSAIIKPLDFLPNLSDDKYYAHDKIAEVDEDQITENSEGSEDQPKISKSLESDAQIPDLNSSYSSTTSLPDFNVIELAQKESAKYNSLADYWKEQAQRRCHRVGTQFSDDLHRMNHIRNQQHPKVAMNLTPRQRQLLNQASAGDKNAQYETALGGSLKKSLANRHLSSKKFISTYT
jgi:hypothetical protein